MGELINTVIEYLKGNIGIITFIILCLGLFVEITPIKINPISSILGWLGKKMNKETDEKLEKLDSKCNGISFELRDHIVQSQRSSILNFANECRRDIKHTKEEFDYVIRLHDDYEQYLEEKNIQNGQITCAFNYILDIYNKCLREDLFI